MASPTRLASPASSIRPSLPGTVGTPARAAMMRAVALSPMARMVSGFGPMKTRPAFSTISAKSAFSDRKAIAGVHRVAAAVDRGLQHRVLVEIGFGGMGRADRHDDVGQASS